MENNTPTPPEVIENNPVAGQGRSKNPMIVIVVLVLVVLVILVIVLKNMNKSTPTPETNQVSETEIGLENAIINDDTNSITDTLDSINLDDTSSTDLNDIDKELEKL